MIAHVCPVYGLYSSFYPTLIYTIFGTSKHVAVGSAAAVVFIMTGDAVNAVMREIGKEAVLCHKRQNPQELVGNLSNVSDEFADVSETDVAIMCTAIVGIYVLIFGVLQMGFLSNFLCEEFVSGFSCSASVYVFTSQIRHLLGLDLPYFSGPFALIKTYIEIFKTISHSNVENIIISTVCIAVLIVFKCFVDKKLKQKGINIPFPIDIIVVIVSTAISHAISLEKKHKVHVMGDIPSGYEPNVVLRLAIL